MRRITAAQIAPFQGSLAEGICCVCGKKGIAVLAEGRNDNGAIQRAFCSIDPCAVAEGWPWLNDEEWRRAS